MRRRLFKGISSLTRLGEHESVPVRPPLIELSLYPERIASAATTIDEIDHIVIAAVEC
jgi:hypothetical protein